MVNVGDQNKKTEQQAAKRVEETVKRIQSEGLSGTNLTALYSALEDAYIDNALALAPAKMSKTGVSLSRYQLDSTRTAYVVCTDVKEASDSKLDQCTAYLSWRSLIQRAARDATNEGIIINPYHETPLGEKVYIPNEILRMILLRAEEKMLVKPTQMTIASMKKEKDRLNDRLELMVNYFDLDCSKENFNQVCKALVDAYIYHLKCSVPMMRGDSQLHYMMYHLSQDKGAYIAYTLYEKPANCLGETLISMPWRDIITHARNNVNCAGLLINPYHPFSHGRMLFLSREVLQDIILYAIDVIKDLSENVRDAVILGL